MQDNEGVTSSSTATITVTGTNDAPVAVADAATAVEAGGVNNGTAGTDPSGNVLTNDTDIDNGDSRTVSAITGGTLGVPLAGAYGSVTLNANGSYSYVLNNSHASVQNLKSGETLTDTFTYTVEDTTSATDTANLVVTIQGANDAPVVDAGIIDAVLDGSGTQTYQFAANAFNDIDADALSYTATYDGGALPSWLTLNSGTRTFSGNAPVGENGTHTVVVTANDSNGGTITDTFILTVSNANDAPTVDAGIANATLDGSDVQSYQFAANAFEDLDADNLTYTATYDGGALPGWLTLDSATRTFSGNAPVNENGAHAVVVTANDGNGGIITDTFTLTVSNANDAPVGVNDLTGAVEAGGVANGTAGTNGTGNVLINDTDDDSVVGDTKAVSAVTGGTVGGATAGSYGTLTLNGDGTYTYVIDNANAAVNSLAAGATLTDTFTYTVQDAAGATDTATLTVTVTGANDNPTSITGYSAVDENSASSAAVSLGTLTSADVDTGNTHTFTITGGADAALFEVVAD
jgi:VCBS repeat-containing protein